MSARLLRARVLVAVALVALALVTGWSVLAGARDLQRAEPAALAAREALLGGDMATADRELGVAATHFSRAAERLGGWAGRLAGAVPVLGRNVRVARAVADAGRLVTAAGGEVTNALDGLPGGLAGLAPSGGAIPIEPVERLAGPLAGAADASRQATVIMDGAPDTWLLAPVARRKAEFESQLEALGPGLESGGALARTLPAFLGADGPRRYLFAAQNPAELRGTGGFIGAVSVVTMHRGRVAFGPFTSIHDLPDPGEVEPATPDQARRWGRFGVTQEWVNANTGPDFPSAATVLERMHEQALGEPVDGVIIADPFALEVMLELGRPVELEGVGEVSADNVVELLASEAYGLFEDHDERKRVLGEVSAEAVRAFLGGGAEPVRAVEALGASVAAGHLLLHAADPETQDAFVRAGLAGELVTPEGDYLAVIANNAAANKADFFTERTVRYRVELAEGGVGAAGLGVRLRNETPTEGLSGHVIGPNTEPLEAGDNLMLLSVYCAPECELASFDGLPEQAMTEDTEHSRPVFDVSVHLASGQVRDLHWGWTLPQAWIPEGQGGRYVLTLQGQPTIRPTRTFVEIVPPAGMAITGHTDEITVEDGIALLDREGSGRIDVELMLGPTVQPGAWERLLEFLRRPLFTSRAEGSEPT